MSLRLGLGIQQDRTPDELIRLVRLAEALGYDTLWYANEKMYRDTYIGLAVAAMHSSRLKLGTFIVDPYTAHPATTAAAIATLDELSGGRAILLLGAGGAGVVPLGIPRPKPATALAEAIQVIRALLSGETVNFEGEVVRLAGGKLHLPARPDIPIYVASRGDRVLEMAGQHADGVMIATYATPAGVQHALERVDAGLAKSGRSREDIRIISRVDGWIASDREQARAAVRSMVARFLTSSYPDVSFVQAVGAEIPPDLEAVLRQKNRELSAVSGHLVTDELVDAFTWAGTIEDVARKVRSVAALGIDDMTILLHPPEGEPVEPGMAAFSQALR
ncbi:MAG: LLM class flavin-dependent oxidoreductase [Chloroflexota bacterium]|nr:LLM class flavin-dependent oxidoreductase [Chloroflexota bacterium]